MSKIYLNPNAIKENTIPINKIVTVDLDGKQDIIDDLEDIRDGAAKGATALQSFAETDPIFSASPAASITNSDITNWNAKTSNTDTITGIKMNGVSKGTSGVVDLGDVITSLEGYATENYVTNAITNAKIEGGDGDPIDLSGYATKDDLNKKVDKVTGKGLSTNDFTDDLKTKLDGISIGAEVNVQSDWNATSGDALILNKPSLAAVATSGDYDDLLNTPSEITESTVSGWGFTKNTGTYSKPETGIPASDLSEDVQTALGKANSALQQHQSLDGKQDKLVSEVNIKTINGESILGSGNIVIEGEGNVFSDWEAKDGTPGYVNNRTHYIESLLSIDTSDYEFVFNSDEDAFSQAQYIGVIGDTSDIYICYKSDHYSNNEGIICNFINPNNNTTTYYSYSIIGIGNIQLAYYRGKLYMKISRGIRNFSFNVGKIFKLNENFIPDVVKQKMIDITWQSLKNLRDTDCLIPGMQYRITDYVTTTAQAWTRSAGHQFDVIVTADDVNILNEKARAIQHDGDEYFKNAHLESWQLWYCLDNDTDRFEWISNEDIVVNRIKVRNDKNELVLLTYLSTKTIDDKTFYRWKTSNNDEASADYIYSDTLDITSESVCYDIVNSQVTKLEGFVFVVEQENVSKGKGVIYRMIDENDNDCPYDFKNIQFMRSFENHNPIVWSHGWSHIEKNPIYFYTFSLYTGDTTPKDWTIDKYYYLGSIKNNKISKYCSSSQKLNNIVFLSGQSGYEFDAYDHDIDLCYGNYFAEDCFDITVLQIAKYNHFGRECNNIVFGGDDNKFGCGVNHLLFERTCLSNVINSSYKKFVGKYRKNQFLATNSTIHTYTSDNVDKFVQNYIVYDDNSNVFIADLGYQTIRMDNSKGYTKQFNIADIQDNISIAISESITNVLNTEV